MYFVLDRLAIGRRLQVVTMIARSRGSRARSIFGSPSAILVVHNSSVRIGSLKHFGSIKGMSSPRAASTYELAPGLRCELRWHSQPAIVKRRETLPSGEPKMVYP